MNSLPYHGCLAIFWPYPPQTRHNHAMYPWLARQVTTSAHRIQSRSRHVPFTIDHVASLSHATLIILIGLEGGLDERTFTTTMNAPASFRNAGLSSPAWFYRAYVSIQISLRLPKFAKIEPHIMPLNNPQTRFYSIFFQDPSSASSAQDRPAICVYMSDIICPFAKIRLI